MKMRLQAPLIPTAATIVVVVVTALLAQWQFSRAEEKAALEQSFDARGAQTPLVADRILRGDDVALLRYRAAVATGEYLPESEILVDNRMHGNQPGYHVITPLALGDGRVMLVNRGWLQAPADRSRGLPSPPPPPVGEVAVTGRLNKDSADAIELADDTVDGKLWQNLKIAEYGRRTELDVLPVVLVEESTADGLESAAVRPDFKSRNSLIYAWQWLSFGALAVVLWLRRAVRIER